MVAIRNLDLFTLTKKCVLMGWADAVTLQMGMYEGSWICRIYHGKRPVILPLYNKGVILIKFWSNGSEDENVWHMRQYGNLLSLLLSPNEKRNRTERGKMLLTLHNLSQFVTSFVLAGMKSPVQPVFLLDLSEDSGGLQWPIGRKKFQKLEISI
jgi:hypothetical protein